MGRYKCAYDCESAGDSDVKFFKFPLFNPRRLKKWLVNMNLLDWTPSRFSVLCIKHFEEHHIDRSGKCVTLKDDAVPTIFHPSGVAQKRKTEPTAAEASQESPAQSAVSKPAAAKRSVRKKGAAQTVEIAGEKDPKKPEKWRIIVDEGLMKIDSFPHFFHGDYCLPGGIQWVPDDTLASDADVPEKVIEVKEPWTWLGLDVRGPLPQTLARHKYILSVTDYFSKWVEAVPMETCHPPHVAKSICDIIAHFGFPLRILSRLPHDIVHRINRELKDQLKVSVPLVVHHRQTGSADPITQQLIDRMVGDLVEEHPPDWDVYLPAKVFSLCFEENSQTKQRPFTLLCCQGLQPVQTPRGLNYTYNSIRESAFMVT